MDDVRNNFLESSGFSFEYTKISLNKISRMLVFLFSFLFAPTIPKADSKISVFFIFVLTYFIFLLCKGPTVELKPMEGL